ncbi:hypothetical protein K0M31_000266 [Melipona bicolor]|uniref:Uncharacterized protein n=1 Tax=Melipona bicolor TaxID=60889 RepID=A0AA40KWJ5_9HYME|nr:hypothetical protein K0M31_000266 [Melipona bicolor]
MKFIDGSDVASVYTPKEWEKKTIDFRSIIKGRNCYVRSVSSPRIDSLGSLASNDTIPHSNSDQISRSSLTSLMWPFDISDFGYSTFAIFHCFHSRISQTGIIRCEWPSCRASTMFLVADGKNRSVPRDPLLKIWNQPRYTGARDRK